MGKGSMVSWRRVWALDPMSGFESCLHHPLALEQQAQEPRHRCGVCPPWPIGCGGGQGEGMGGLHSGWTTRAHRRCAQMWCRENNSASCGDFKSPHPVYRCTFLQLKEKLLEIGVCFPDVIGMMPTVFSGRHQGVGSGRAGWEVMQLWTKALGSLQREVRWGPWVLSWLSFHLLSLNSNRKF